jgi:DNA-directed RNA polymerase subunit M
MMHPKEEKGKKFFACSCGYSDKKAGLTQQKVIKETVKDVKGEKVELVSEQDTTLPITEEVCPNCGHGRAYWWTKQMRASDEPETKFLKCEKCKTTWRDRN